MLSDFHFIRPAWLLLLPIVVSVWWLGRRWQDPLRGWRAVMDDDLLDSLTIGAEHLKSLARRRAPYRLGDLHHRRGRSDVATRTITFCRRSCSRHAVVASE